MAKLPARKGDAVSNDPHGDGEITGGDSGVLFMGKPVACVGDSAKFADGTEGTINEGGGCVVINGKRIALVGDSTTESGTIADGAGGIKVDEGNSFVELGPNVFIGPNVVFSTKPQPTFNQHFVIKNNQTGDPMPYMPYRITTGSGEIIAGISDENGKTEFVYADEPESIKIEILE